MRLASPSSISDRFMMTGVPSRNASPMARASLYVRGWSVVIRDAVAVADAAARTGATAAARGRRWPRRPGRRAGSGCGRRLLARRTRRTRRTGHRSRPVRGRPPSCASRRPCVRPLRLVQPCPVGALPRGHRSSPARYPTGGRYPRTALPSRTCVAPCRTAASRSADIPAETTVASGWLGGHLGRDLGQPGEGEVGVGASGATAITPRRVKPRCRGHGGRPAPATSCGAAPPRPGRVVQAHLHQHLERVGRSLADGVAQRPDQLGPVDRLDDVARTAPPNAPCWSAAVR